MFALDQNKTMKATILSLLVCGAVFTCLAADPQLQSVQVQPTAEQAKDALLRFIRANRTFNAPIDRPTRLFVDSGADLFGGGITVESIPVCDQYTIQGDAFSKAVIDGGEVPVPLEEAIRNMAVIEAVFKSAESSQWEVPQAD